KEERKRNAQEKRGLGKVYKRKQIMKPGCFFPTSPALPIIVWRKIFHTGPAGAFEQKLTVLLFR
ncbi:hypothetical protein, partial [Escherichia coli]|uniref:hypothetical protein n=1 Tax=Escherichia coli TaxID=562 RepID=UPI001BC83B47